MIRTRFREDQGKDIDFLSEDEGYQRFLIREGMGTNDANFTIEDGYTLKIDGYNVNSLTISETTGGTIVHEVKEIEFNDAYGFNVVDETSGKVRINFSSAWNPITVNGEDDLDASGEEELEIIAGDGITITTNTGSNPKSLTIEEETRVGTFTPVVKLGATTQTLTKSVGYWSQAGRTITIVIAAEFTKTGTGDLSISGLFFTSHTITDMVQVLPANFEGIAGGTTYGSGVKYGDEGSVSNEVQAYLDPNSTTLYFRRSNSTVNIDDGALTDSTINISITGSYIKE